MKKTYNKPTVEIEVYSLDTSIASNCATVVDNGPELGGHKACDSYLQVNPWIMSSERAPVYNVDFYDEHLCTCYTSAGDGQYWTS